MSTTPQINDSAETLLKKILTVLNNGGGGSGGGDGYIDGVVNNPTELPVTVGTPALDSVYIALNPSGVWLINRKPAGLYNRIANNGDADDWLYLGAFPDVNNANNWELYDGTDPTKELKFDLSNLLTGTTRTVSAPAGNGQMLVEGQSIGGTTPASGTFTTLNSTVATGAGITVTDTTTSADFNNLIDCVRDSNSVFLVRDDGIVTAALGVNASTNAGLVTAGGGNGGVRIRADYTLHWVSTGFTNTGTPDTFLRRDGQADTLAMYNGTNSQEFRLYNTRTSSTNYERGFFSWVSNVFRIGTEQGSVGGSARPLQLWTNDEARVTVLANGYVGIGTSGPQRLLDLSGPDSNARLRVRRIISGTPYGMEVAVDASGSGILAGEVSFATYVGPSKIFTCTSGLNISIENTRNFEFSTGTGTKFGTSTTQKFAFWNANPVAQPAAIADATDAATTQARLNDLLAAMRTLGLIAT